MQRRDDLRALADRRGDPLDRARRGRRRSRRRRGRLVSSGRRSSPASAPVSTKPLASSATPDPASQSVFGSAPMNRNRWRIGRRTSSPDARSTPADRLQHAVAAFEAGDAASASAPRHWRGPRCGRPDSATCSPRDRARAPAARPWRPGSPDRPRPDRPNCRRRPAPPPARRTASPRAARPNSARSRPRTRRGSSTASRR